jgi:hypothetical protein
MSRNYLPPDEPEPLEEYYPVRPRRRQMEGHHVAAIVGALSALLVMASFLGSCWLIFECPSPLTSTTRQLPERIK